MKSINYTYSLSERDSVERDHIKAELHKIKIELNIKGYTILELGCGLGQNLEVFKEDNNVLGIEGVPDIVEQARNGVNVVLGDIEQEICVLDSTQDIILCLDVLEHLQYPLELLINAKKKLKNQGRIIINVPNHFDWKGRLKILLGSSLDVHNYFPGTNDWDNPHLRFFTYEGIKALINTAGLKVEDDRSANFKSIPLQKVIKNLRLDFISNYLSKRYPSLFVSGFFIIAGKS